MFVRCGIAAFVATTFLSPAPIQAQDREGFWLGAGGGYGFADLTCSACLGGREGAGVGYFKVGWGLNDRVLVGAEGNFWTNEFEADVLFTAAADLYQVSATIVFYPDPSGFFVKGGVGGAFADVNFEAGAEDLTVDIGTGLGLILGVGYDVPIRGRISLTPALNYWHGRLGDVELRGFPLAFDWKQHVIDITVGITFQ